MDILPATEAHSDVMLTILAILLFFRLGRKYLLARNGPYTSEVMECCVIDRAYHCHNTVLIDQRVRGSVEPILGVHFDPAAVHQDIESLIIAIALSCGSNALLL